MINNEPRLIKIPICAAQTKIAQKKRLAERTLAKMKMLFAYSKSKTEKTDCPPITRK